MSGSLPAVLVRPSILSCCTLVVAGAAAAEVVGSSGGRSALVVFLASGTVGMLVKIGSVVEAVEDAGEVGDESALVALPELLEPREEPWPLLELSEEPLEELKPENNDLNQARMLLRSRAPVLLAAVGAGGGRLGAGCRGTNKGAARHRNGCCDSGDGFGQGHFSCIVLAHGAHSNDKKKEKASNVILI